MVYLQTEIYHFSFMNTNLNKYINSLAKQDGDIYAILKNRIWKDNKSNEIIETIAAKLSKEELELASKYKSVGLFNTGSEQKDLACYWIVLNAEYERELNKQKKICQGYSGEETMFTNNSSLKIYNGDLIDYSTLDRIKDSNVINLKNGYARIDTRINPCFYNWLDECFKNSDRYVHVDPNTFSISPLKDMILECMINPPQKDWWKNLTIYKGQNKGSRYDLMGNNPNDKDDEYDYNVKKVRRLEVSEARNYSGNLSMMIEELSQFQNQIDPNKQYVVGRMIHLDSDAQIGTPFENAILNHIDLAINLYIDDTALNRLDQDLSKCNKIVNATCRTHLLRVNNIPFKSLFKFAYAFFISKKLVDEWIKEECSIGGLDQSEICS